MAISTNGPSTLTTERWTAARVRDIPDDRNTYEVIDGELPALASPAHPTLEPLTLDLRQLFRPLGAGKA